MEDLLRIFCNHQQDDWAEWLLVIQYIINSRPSSATGKAPYELWMGHIPSAHQEAQTANVPKLLERKEALDRARNHAAKAVQHAQEKWVKTTNYQSYNKGDKVWLEGTNLHTTHPTHKLRPKCYGPFEVEEVVGPVNF